MAEEKEEMVFPIVREACPCGCEERLGKMTIDRLIEKGFLSKGLYPDGPMFQIPLIDQRRITALVTPTVKVPIITVFWDVCKDCMTMYCTKFQLDIQDAPVQVQQQGPPAGQKFSTS